MIGLCIPGAEPLSLASELMRLIFAELIANGAAHNQLLFPYSDDLLLTGRLPGMFGTHALLSGVTPERLARSFAAARKSCGVKGCRPAARELSNPAELAAFFSEHILDTPGSVKLGSFTELLAGRFTPWGIRQQARRFTSFAEHLSRLPKTEVLGFSGGALAVRLGDIDICEATSLYMMKTGAFWKI